MLEDRFKTAMAAFPCIAILRGLKPSEAIEVGQVLWDAGFRIIEVPLNSPRPLDSIRLLSEHFKGRAIIGAGTVLQDHEVDRVQAAGGEIIVSPNMSPAVITRSQILGLISAPGVQTVSEAFAAIDAGANCLKFFPGEAVSPSLLKAMRAVLPPDMPCVIVGGVKPELMSGYLAVGAAGFGIGSAVFKPGDTAQDVALKSQGFAQALAAL